MQLRTHNNGIKSRNAMQAMKLLAVLQLNSDIMVPFAFRRHCRVSGSISAIVIDSILWSNPLKSSILISIQVLKLLLIPPPHSLCGTEFGLNRCLTTVDMKSPVRSDERSLAPVSLLEAASCRPIIGIPQAWIDLHWLIEGEPHSQILAILEHSNWHIIHIETAIANGKLATS